MSERAHYNLYYIFLERESKIPLPRDKMEEAFKIFEKNFKNLKPNAKKNPHIDKGGKNPTEN